MKKTALYDHHRAQGATFAQIHDGWELVSHFTDAESEHHTVRNHVGLIDLSHRGRLRLTGADRVAYLHRLTSNDVEGLKVGEGNYATFLTNRGKVIADMHVHVLEDALSVTTNAETTEILAKELDKYIIADDVTLENVTEQTGAIAVYGPKSAELIHKALGFDARGLAEDHVEVHQIDTRSVTCIRNSETGEVGYELHAETESLVWLWDTLLEGGHDFNATPVGLTALNSLRIEAGIPRYGAELTDTVIPLEAELENAIDFNKGCYIGQEIVARMKYRGHPNRLLRGFEIESTTQPQQGDKLFDGEKEIGWITSAVNSPTLGKTIALGYVRMAFTDSGSKVEVETIQGRVSAIVVYLPFYERDGLSLTKN